MRALAIPVLLLVLTAGFFWKLTLTREFTWLEDPAVGAQTLPWLDFQARELHARRLPLWNPHTEGGQSLLGLVQPGAANPLNWLLFALRLRNGHIQMVFLQWYWVLLHWLAALAAYALCRGLGASPGASLLGGAVYGLGGFVGSTIAPQSICAALWIPLVLLFVLRALNGERPAANGALGGLVLGLAGLSGDLQIPLFIAIVTAGLWLLGVARQRLPVLRGAALFGAIALLVSALQTVPALEWARRTAAWSATVPYPVHWQNSLGARGVLGLLIPGWQLNVSSFVGVTVLILALVGLAVRWDTPGVKWLAVAALGGLVIALGPDSVFHGAIYGLLPWVRKAIHPARAIVITHAALAALAALGLDAWPRFRARRGARRLLLAFGASILGIYLVLAVLRIPAVDERPMMTGLAALLLAAVLYGWDRRNLPARAATTCILGLALLEAGAVSTFSIPQANRAGAILPRMRDNADIGNYLRSQPGWVRAEVDPADVPYNFGDWFGVDRAWAAGAHYRVATKPADPGQITLFDGANELKAYRDDRFGQPVWTVPDCAGSADFQVESRTSTSLVLTADLRCNATVVLGARYAPGWRVWVDGRRSAVREIDGKYQGVGATAGRRRLEFRYRPNSVYWGAGLALAGVLLAGICSRMSRPRLQSGLAP
jgi:hypothetical protein